MSDQLSFYRQETIRMDTVWLMQAVADICFACLGQGGRLNLDAQIDNYANSRHDLIARHGEVAAVSLLRGALFSVTMGSNDFINNYLTPILSVPERASTPPAAFIGAMIAKYRQQLTVGRS